VITFRSSKEILLEGLTVGTTYIMQLIGIGGKRDRATGATRSARSRCKSARSGSRHWRLFSPEHKTAEERTFSAVFFARS
jgi:hypothetical protein